MLRLGRQFVSVAGVIRTVVKTLLGLLAAALGFTLLLYAVGLLLRPDVQTPPAAPDAVLLAQVEEARKLSLNKENPPRIHREVDYGEGEAGAWWPKAQSPLFDKLERSGALPPLAQRVGPEPIVLEGVEGIGRYGGTWHRLAASQNDLTTVTWRLSYSSLVRWSPEGYPIVPHLAKSWEVSPDYRHYTFHLRKGLRWSDGVPVTASDIEYWYEHEVKAMQSNPRVLRNGSGLGRVEKVDDYTVRFLFDEPNALFLERLAALGANPVPYMDEYVLPSHYLKRFHPDIGDQQVIATHLRVLKLASARSLYQRIKAWNNPEHPRLWPWIYRTHTASGPYVFVRNPYYGVVDTRGNQLPYLDRLVMDVRPNTMFGLTAAAGQVSMQDRFIRYEDHVLLMSEAQRHDYTVYHWYSASRSQFTINPVINRRVDPARPETLWKNRLLNDRRFRQALSLAINRQDIIDALFNGQGEPAQVDPGPDTEFYSEKLFKSFTEFDPARANRLLDELGLTGRDAEGYRTFPDGTRMVWFLNMTEYTGNDPAQFVVDDWARVGVRCIQRIRARPLFYAEKHAYEHDFSVWTSESEFLPLIEPRSFLPTYNESLFAPAFGIWYQNGGLYGNPAANRPAAHEPPVDHPLRRSMELIEAIYQSGNPVSRRELFRQIQESNAEEVWTISIATSPPQLVVVKNGFRNVAKNALYGAIYQTPGNAGLETYFWDNPSDPPGVADEIRRALLQVELEPAMREARLAMTGGGGAEPVPSSLSLMWILRVLLGTCAIAGLALIAFRHPYVGRRLVLMVPTLGFVSLAVFCIVQLPPGDFATTRMIEFELTGTPSTTQLADDLRANFYLDEPLAKRYLRWVGLYWFVTFEAADLGLLQGHLGQSMEHDRSVNEVVGDRILLTLVVSVATVLLTWLIALPTGIYSAVRQYSWTDYGLTLFAFLGMSVPAFLLAVIVMYFADHAFGLQVSGLFSPEYATTSEWSAGRFIDLMKHLWVPVLVLGLGGTAALTRVMRANLLDELRKPYVTTARAKGMRPLRLLFKYPVRLALNPFVSGLGGLFPQLVSGGAIVALVLSLPMVGPTLLDALLTEDVYLAGSMLMVMSLLGVLGTLVSDLLLLWLDPRIRLDGR